jgi:hypothetical protein
MCLILHRSCSYFIWQTHLNTRNYFMARSIVLLPGSTWATHAAFFLSSCKVGLTENTAVDSSLYTYITYVILNSGMSEEQVCYFPPLQDRLWWWLSTADTPNSSFLQDVTGIMAIFSDKAGHLSNQHRHYAYMELSYPVTEYPYTYSILIFTCWWSVQTHTVNKL